MDANRYFDAMHNAMSAQHPGAQLLLTVKLQDTCGNDACLELKQLPGESTSILCYSTMGRRCLNFQLFRKGWQLCHNADGQLVGRFPSSADGLIDETDFRAYCREDRLDLARTQRITAELRQCAGIDYQGSIPQNARTGAVVTVESFVGAGARWTYWSQDVLPSLPLGAILYWLADHLAGAERRTCIGCVEQHFSRVPGTVLEQITLGDPQITAEMAWNAAKLAGIDEAIQALPEGCDTVCSDGMFSQGEWQLLSIARAAAADPAVLLLDEVTANLDAETEARVLEALRRASAGRTVLSVSHRIYENLGGRTVKIEPQSM